MRQVIFSHPALEQDIKLVTYREGSFASTIDYRVCWFNQHEDMDFLNAAYEWLKTQTQYHIPTEYHKANLAHNWWSNKCEPEERLDLIKNQVLHLEISLL